MTVSSIQPRAYSPETVLTPQQVAEWLQVSSRTLQRLPIPHVRVGHRTVRYTAKDVLAYLARITR
jgi:excisionase family DNA binding protein